MEQVVVLRGEEDVVQAERGDSVAEQRLVRGNQRRRELVKANAFTVFCCQIGSTENPLTTGLRG